jgi:hypothetical protein
MLENTFRVFQPIFHFIKISKGADQFGTHCDN